MNPNKLPKTAQKFSDKIMHWDDERGDGNSLIVTLQYGWCLDAKESHVFGVATVAEAVSDLKRVEPCNCQRCLNKFGG